MKKGQVWIETVLYTLVGLAIIGVILALVKPAIDEKRDELVLTTAVDVLEGIDNQVQEIIHYGVGNSRNIEVTLKKGQLVISGSGNETRFEMESKFMFSEPNKDVTIGRISALTTEIAKKKYKVVLRISYTSDIKFNEQDIDKTLQASSTPYNLAITNKGSYIDFSLVLMGEFLMERE